MSGLVKGSMADICRRLEARSFGLVKGLLAEVSCLEAFEPRFLLRSRERRYKVLEEGAIGIRLKPLRRAIPPAHLAP